MNFYRLLIIGFLFLGFSSLVPMSAQCRIGDEGRIEKNASTVVVRRMSVPFPEFYELNQLAHDYPKDYQFEIFSKKIDNRERFLIFIKTNPSYIAEKPSEAGIHLVDQFQLNFLKQIKGETRIRIPLFWHRHSGLKKHVILEAEQQLEPSVRTALLVVTQNTLTWGMLAHATWLIVKGSQLLFTPSCRCYFYFLVGGIEAGAVLFINRLDFSTNTPSTWNLSAFSAFTEDHSHLNSALVWFESDDLPTLKPTLEREGWKEQTLEELEPKGLIIENL